MTDLTESDRQMIVNRVFTYFVVDQYPAGRRSGVRFSDLGIQRPMCERSFAIGIAETNGCRKSKAAFLATIQREHDAAVRHAATRDSDSRCFREDLADRLYRLTQLCGLEPPQCDRG